ncbi:hypothetical protein XOO3220 [Xanthomonas oryzae pv. oryzae KACC 10331]|uniref:Uncharacterized protein n=1 Tax=Xanthomonas oryzae pv. oryzae (strain KACC10331 / KXO85) TaxID=291331 RepID=Q5GXU7_XANOR|nr:hypothetical protein XOO3220 [Xanthomonas oryzae pv. oryzae KACC 10331]
MLGQRNCRLLVHPLQRQQVLGGLSSFQAFFFCQRGVEQRIAGTGAQFFDDVFVEAFDRQQLANRHVGDFFDRVEAFGHQDRGDFFVHFQAIHEQLACRCLLGLGLGGHLISGHHVELPAGQAAGQTHVLAALADRLRQAVFCHGQVHRVLVFIDDDRLHFGRRHRVDDEVGRILVPQHDVHALAIELVGDRLDARTTHTDARADRIGAGVVRDHGDLGAVARIACAGIDLDQALAHFRHFKLEQFDHEFRRGAADEQLRATRLGTHFGQITADAVAGTQHVARNALVLRNEGFGIAAQIDKDIAALGALDHTGDQLTDAILPRIDHLLTLGFAHTLHDHLLGSLRGDTTEVWVFDLFFDVVAHIHAVGFVDGIHQTHLAVRGFHHHVIGNHFPTTVGFVGTVLVIDGDAGQHVLVGVALLRCGSQRGLDRIEDHFARHAFFIGDRIHYQQKFLTHFVTPRAACQPPTRWMVSSSRARFFSGRAYSVSAVPGPTRPNPAGCAPCRCYRSRSARPCRRWQTPRRQPRHRYAGFRPGSGADHPAPASRQSSWIRRHGARTVPA